MKIYFTVTLLLLLFFQAQSQHYIHRAIWTRVVPSYTLSKNWALQGEFHYRRQNDLIINPCNPLGAPLLNAYRAGAIYRSGQWTFTLWALAWFNANPSLGKPTDYDKPMVHEFRPSLLTEWTLPFNNQHSIRFRGGYEYRHYADGPAGGRWRFRIMTRHQITQKLYGYFWNETLWTGTPAELKKPYFEINRSNISLGYSLNKHLMLEGGYQFTHRQRKTVTEFDEEHAAVISILAPF